MPTVSALSHSVASLLLDGATPQLKIQQCQPAAPPTQQQHGGTRLIELLRLPPPMLWADQAQHEEPAPPVLARKPLLRPLKAFPIQAPDSFHHLQHLPPHDEASHHSSLRRITLSSYVPQGKAILKAGN